MTDQSHLPPAATSSNGSRKKLIVVLVVIAVIVAVVVGVFLLSKGGSSSVSPTATPTPTPSVTQSPSPTPTPTKVANVSVLSASHYYTGSDINVVGEVQNNLGTNVKDVEVVVIFYDSADTIIGADSVNTEIDILKPHQKSPFKLTGNPGETAASYSINVHYNTTQDQPFEGLTIVSQTASIDQEGLHNVVGKVKNNGASEATHVIVVGTYYDSVGKVIGISFTYADPTTINAGTTASFMLTSYPLAVTPARYELQVQGQ